MRKYCKWLWCLVLALTVCMALSVGAGAADIASGTCGGEGDGSNLTWILSEDNTLTISGKGAMADYSGFTNTAPWREYWSDVRYLKIDSGVTTIGNYAFYSCQYIYSVDISDSVTSIGKCAFMDCVNLRSIDLPGGVATIGECAFEFSGIRQVSIPAGVTAVASRAFRYCDDLCSVTIPESVTSIGSKAFEHCESLTQVAIPSAVTAIGERAFEYCGLTRVEIPASVTSIGPWAFYGNSGMTAITVDAANRNYSSDDAGVLFNKDKTTLLQAPGAITAYEVPATVTSLGEGCFSACDKLTTLTIPGSVTRIDFGSIYGEDANSNKNTPALLTEIHFTGNAPVFADTAFTYCEGVKIFYPAGNATWTEEILTGDYNGYGQYITWTAEPPGFPGAGSGTAEDPYLVSTPQTLDAVRLYSDAYFLQTGDIDMTGRAWTPIGTFSGTYDGGAYRIIGLHVSRGSGEDSATVYFGGLMDLCTGTVQNVRLEGLTMEVTVSGRYMSVHTGGIVGRGKTVKNCHSSGTLTQTMTGTGTSYVGGVAGDATGSLKNCTGSVSVTVEDSGKWYTHYIGGVLGSGSVDSCANLGSVTATVSANSYDCNVGGVVGAGSAEKSYNRGAISVNSGTDPTYVGGVCGQCWAYIWDCYNAGSVTVTLLGSGSERYVGGVVGAAAVYSGDVARNYNAGAVTVTGSASVGAVRGGGMGSPEYSYYLNTSCPSGQDNAAALTAEQMRVHTSFEGFNFSTVWCYGTDETYPYPVLRVFGDVGHVFTTYISNADAACGVDGTETAWCDICGQVSDTRTDVGSALEHSFTSYQSDGNATCETDGTKTAFCDHGCGEKDTVTDIGSAHGHSFTSYQSDGNATCETDGTKTASCDHGCGEKDTVTDVGSAHGHSFTSYQSDGNATCETDGTKTAFCDHGCGEKDTVTDVGSAYGHQWSDWKLTMPTYIRDGSMKRSCGRCPEEEVQILPATGQATVDAIGRELESGRLTFTGVPADVTVMAAAYHGGWMVYVNADAKGGVTLPDDLEYDSVRVFFLTRDFVPIAEAVDMP